MSLENVLPNLISNATRHNWEKLSTLTDDRLSSRANKKLSQKNIIPIEYFSNINNIPFVEKLIAQVKIKKYKIENIIYSLGINILSSNNIINNENVKIVLKGYRSYTLHNDLLTIKLPSDEKDILGIIYQCLLSEGEKNISGAYYTSSKITNQMTSNLDFSNHQNFLDPCCGSGAFLLSIENVNPNQLYGLDINPIAVFIAKINLLIKYKNINFIPNIFCKNFLDDDVLFNNTKIDYIVTNPPWGASNVVTSSCCKFIISNESFSLFFVKAFNIIKSNGIVKFLFPESILNVKLHRDIRTFILEKTSLNQITYYKETFAGVTTKFVDILVKKETKNNIVKIVKDNKISSVNVNTFYNTENKVFTEYNDIDNKILQDVRKKGKYKLDKSIWALGIVTGDNKNKLVKKQLTNYEPIYTGKEITKYTLLPPHNFIFYDRNSLQQVAKNEYYRATEKLVYKFISNKLVFAYDNSGALFLNSANILIPKIPNMSIKSVMAFLNSELFQYLYCKMFSEIKILKGNLMELPFPNISEIENKVISNCVDNIINGDDSYIALLQDEIYRIYNIDSQEKKYIRGFINGTFN